MTPAERLAGAIEGARERYYRLVLIVGKPRSGKTMALRAAADALGRHVVNLNLLLTERLLALTKKQRALRVRRVLLEELNEHGTEPVLLDNIEVLFDPDLAQDPLSLLQGLSRSRTLAAAWPGSFDGTHLTYAEPSHPEWKRYSNPEASIVTIEDGAAQPVPAQHESPHTGALEKR
jgi:hypothetical protein